MTGLLVVLIPLLLMLFAFSMERIEASLLHTHEPKQAEAKLAMENAEDLTSDEDDQPEASAA